MRSRSASISRRPVTIQHDNHSSKYTRLPALRRCSLFVLSSRILPGPPLPGPPLPGPPQQPAFKSLFGADNPSERSLCTKVYHDVNRHNDESSLPLYTPPFPHTLIRSYLPQNNVGVRARQSHAARAVLNLARNFLHMQYPTLLWRTSQLQSGFGEGK